MKPNDTKHQGLFEKARQAPTELSRSKVETLIKSFPTIPPDSIQPPSNWSHLFSLNNLIMMSISVVIVVALSMSNTNGPNKLKVNELNNLSFEITNHEIPGIQYVETKTVERTDTEVHNKAKTDSVIKAENNNNTNTNSEFKTNSILKEKKSKLVSPTNTNKIQSHSKFSQEQLVNANRESIKNPSTQQTLVPKKELNSQHIGAPDLSSSQMRQLKKSLYKNLLEDQLIQSKEAKVKMWLPGKVIFLNQERIPNDLYAKYADLTRIAGTGMDRAIEMTGKYIKVGDFTKEGFKGNGVGTFIEKYIDAPFLDKQERESEVSQLDPKDQRKELFIFANKILRKSDIKSKGKSLFQVRIKGETLKLLHEELYAQLLLDNLIETKNDLVFIQLPKYDIAINGKKLQVPLPTKYLNIIEAYKIKHAGSRAILLSRNSISVGDYIEGELTGTSVDIKEN